MAAAGARLEPTIAQMQAWSNVGDVALWAGIERDSPLWLRIFAALGAEPTTQIRYVGALVEEDYTNATQNIVLPPSEEGGEPLQPTPVQRSMVGLVGLGCRYASGQLRTQEQVLAEQEQACMGSQVASCETPPSMVTGMPPGPFQVGVTTMQLSDQSRKDATSGGPRKLQTEIWYPAADEAAQAPRNKYSDFLGRGVIPGSIDAAEEGDAIGGYLPGLTIGQLDQTWPNEAVRDARPCGTCSRKWPLVIFSHGSGAFRASYIYWTEFLASHGFVVMACDHAGSARYTQLDGQVVKPGGERSTRASMEADRPQDMLFLIDCMEALASGGADSRFAGRVDTTRVALTGMSFGGWATAAALEAQDARVRAGIMQCPSIAMSGAAAGIGVGLSATRSNLTTPVMVMLGSEDTVIGEEGNAAGRQYVDTHAGPACLVEIVRGGHVSFTSCELYNPEYGNGIGVSKSLTKPGETYTPLDISEQHAIANSYGLAFLNAHLRGDYDGEAGAHASADQYNANFLTDNHFGDELVHRASKL